MSDGDRRVEPRQLLVGRGSGTTPERVDELRQKAAELDKASQPKPTKDFSKVLAAGRDDKSEEELTEKEKRLRQLPKKGPRPGLVHPAQRDAYGRDDEAEDSDVILKG